MAVTQLAAQDLNLLSLIREGRVDAEIAVRLGVSTAEVKDRVQKLASELGVGGRPGLVQASALAPKPIVVARAAPANASEPRVQGGRSRLMPGFAALAIFFVVAAMLVFNTGSRTPSRPSIDRGDATLSLPVDPIAAKTGSLVRRNGRDAVDAGFPFTVPGSPYAFETTEQRGEVTRLVLAGGGVFELEPTEGIDWRATSVRVFPLTFTFAGSAAGRPISLHLMVADETTKLERMSDGRLAISNDSGKPELLAWVDGVRSEFTSNGQMFIDREEFPTAVAIAYDTGEWLEVGQATPIGFGSEGWNGTFCGADPGSCYVVTRPGPATIPADGQLVCANGVLQLTSPKFRLEFHRLDPGGPEWPGCDPFAVAPVAVSADDPFTPRNHYRITAADSQGNPLSVVAARDGRLFVGEIARQFACPCRSGN